MWRILLGTLGLGLLIASLAAANLRRDPDRTSLDWQILKAPPREVTLGTLERGPIVRTIAAPGEVELVEEAEIASQIVGRVVAVEVRDGDRVNAGDVLVRLDDTDTRARLDSANARIARLQAAIAQSDSDLEKSTRDLGRLGQLIGRGAASRTEVDDARSFHEKAQAALVMSRNELIEAQAMLRASEEDLRRTVIRSPIDGVVAGLEVEVGEVVIAGTTNLPGTVLMTVGDPARLRVRADVDETDVPAVRPEQPSRIYLLANSADPIPGRVDRVAPKGRKEGEVVSFETLVEIEGTDPALRPAMTATVEIEVERAPDALGIPVQAVVHRRRKDLPDTPAIRAWIDRHARTPGDRAREAEARYVKLVFVVEDGVAHARPVETGISDERRVAILGGLEPTDRVIVGPFRALDELKDGDPVIESLVTSHWSLVNNLIMFIFA
jgi:HlyD family secretion protein